MSYQPVGGRNNNHYGVNDNHNYGGNQYNDDDNYSPFNGAQDTCELALLDIWGLGRVKVADPCDAHALHRECIVRESTSHHVYISHLESVDSNRQGLLRSRYPCFACLPDADTQVYGRIACLGMNSFLNIAVKAGNVRGEGGYRRL